MEPLHSAHHQSWDCWLLVKATRGKKKKIPQMEAGDRELGFGETDLGNEEVDATAYPDAKELDLKGQVLLHQMKLNGSIKPPPEPKVSRSKQAWSKVQPYVSNKYLIAVFVGLAILILLVIVRPPLVLSRPEDPLEPAKVNWWVILSIAAIGALLPVITPMIHQQLTKGKHGKGTSEAIEKNDWKSKIKKFFFDSSKRKEKEGAEPKHQKNKSVSQEDGFSSPSSPNAWRSPGLAKTQGKMTSAADNGYEMYVPSLKK